jgi:hypothetical protein
MFYNLLNAQKIKIKSEVKPVVTAVPCWHTRRWAGNRSDAKLYKSSVLFTSRCFRKRPLVPQYILNTAVPHGVSTVFYEMGEKQITNAARTNSCVP